MLPIRPNEPLINEISANSLMYYKLVMDENGSELIIDVVGLTSQDPDMYIA